MMVMARGQRSGSQWPLGYGECRAEAQNHWGQLPDAIDRYLCYQLMKI